ncbi:MAG: hypothetical protein B6D77_15515 [gamma proteobacterium symbiont of Ctena orbiculata]|nr:MAG: hypothetical protein B6D77_15515 [gamma proteobacterium symbiont of Ctena orbiculata]PVV20614.1 MAG: hypothetical protein B6D78_10365 [gamma proteobacterium symbiont of Ctena orbiculata]PVV26198.1 MAG: hypothetical protein B6D79_07070 [gamma proteobacterium symbiont of Ctena orbiculata]
MGDYTLGARGSRFNLGNFQLRLDPEIEAQMSQIRAGSLPPRIQRLFLQPNWRSFDRNLLNYMMLQTPATTAPSTPPAAGPATPRPGQVGDVMRAVWLLPPVQQTANRLLQDSQRRLRREWNQGGVGTQIMMVTAAATVVGTSLTALLVNQQTRELVLGFVNGRQLPVPGIRGFSVQLRGRGRGGGAQLRNIGGSGVSVRGGASHSATTGNIDWDVGMTLDLTQLVPALR